MKYVIELKPKAEKDLKELQEKDRTKLIERLRLLENDLGGDAKMLTNHTPEYRMRSDDLRILREEKASSSSEPARKLDDILAEIGQ